MGTLELYQGWSVATMAVKVDSKTVVFENPLVPNRVLREMYRKLVEGRLIEEHGSKKHKKPTTASAQEACRVSVTQGLAEDDLVMDSQSGSSMKYLLGMKLTEALAKPQSDKSTSRKIKPTATRLLPFIEDAEARLFAALGAAMLQQKNKATDLTVVFVGREEVGPDLWQRVLGIAVANRLPVIFVSLPDQLRKTETKSKHRASEIALRCGLPGIPVDASDVVALYRVAQESIGRIRIGGGAVLIEGLPFQDSSRIPEYGDAVAQLGEALLRRQAATALWMEGIEKTFRRRLELAQKM